STRGIMPPTAAYNLARLILTAANAGQAQSLVTQHGAAAAIRPWLSESTDITPFVDVLHQLEKAAQLSAPPAADRSEFSRYIPVEISDLLSKRKPVNLKETVNGSDVVLLADVHTNLAVKDFIQSHLQMLKDLGFNYFAIEMLVSDFQKDLNVWDEGAKSRIRKGLEGWESKGPGIVDAYMHLIDTAKSLGLTVIAMEDPNYFNIPRNRVNPYW